MSGSFNWSWADYERERRKWEREQERAQEREQERAADLADAPDENEIHAPHSSTADSAGGCDALPPEGSNRAGHERWIEPGNGSEPHTEVRPESSKQDAGQSERADLDRVHDQPAKTQTRSGGRARSPAAPPQGLPRGNIYVSKGVSLHRPSIVPADRYDLRARVNLSGVTNVNDLCPARRCSAARASSARPRRKRT